MSYNPRKHKSLKRSFSGIRDKGACFKECANRDVKCGECLKLHGKETEFIEMEV